MIRKSTTNKLVKTVVTAWLITLGLSTILPMVTYAQFTQPLGGQQQSQFGEPLPPPIGDGSSPTPVNPGDNVAPNPPGSGQADQTAGTNFSTATGHSRTIVRIYRQTSGGAVGTPRGQRESQEIRPDQL